MTFRDFLARLDQEGELQHFEEEVSREYEIAKRLDSSEDAILFENVEGTDVVVAGNVYGSRDRISDSLGVDKDRLIEKMRESLADPKDPDVVSKAPVQEVVEEGPDLGEYPILEHFEGDGGPYVTSAIIAAEDSEGKRNLSFHRMKLIDEDRFTVRVVPRDLYRMFKESEEDNEPLQVAAIFGVDVGLALAAATSLPYEVDEYGLANNLIGGLELVECRSLDLEVPAGAEIVMEGEFLPGERAPEGPFADITGTYDAVRQQPVFEVDLITSREDPIYPALLPGGPEHKLLMGTPREPVIYEEVDGVTESVDVALTPGGCGWLHAIVSIDKEKEDAGREAIRAAFRGHSSLKHVVVVDDDIDIYDPGEVEWAIATRFRADRDAIIESEVEGSSLDPTADPETRLGSKMGVDATKDLGDNEKYERARIPD